MEAQLQGGMSNEELRAALKTKLPNVEPGDRDLSMFALGVESASSASPQGLPEPDLEIGTKLVPYEERHFRTPGMAAKLGYTDNLTSYYKLTTVEALLTARSDALVKALEAALKHLEQFADNEYVRGIELARRNACLGWEHKAKTGVFGAAEFDAHKAMNLAMGSHFGIYRAIASLRSLQPGAARKD
jgi:hypothetical protein